MKKFFLLLILCCGLLGILMFQRLQSQPPLVSGAPPYSVGEETIPPIIDDAFDLLNWKRPEGPLRVGIQVGHWKSDELPEELKRLRGNSGASGFGKSEWEVNYEIAVRTKEILEKEGIVVDLLPATIPPHY